MDVMESLAVLVVEVDIQCTVLQFSQYHQLQATIHMYIMAKAFFLAFPGCPSSNSVSMVS